MLGTQITDYFLRDISQIEREALLRFYVLEQTPEQIHKDLGLDAAQLLELKSRVKAAYLAGQPPQ